MGGGALGCFRHERRVLRCCLWALVPQASFEVIASLSIAGIGTHNYAVASCPINLQDTVTSILKLNLRSGETTC